MIQRIETQAPLPAGKQWVLAGWLIDGQGGPVRCNVLICLAQGRIISLEERRPHDNPSVDVDLSHATVIPALMDAHVHLALSGTRDPRIRQRQLTPSRHEAHTVIAAHLEQHSRYGICAVRDAGDRQGHVQAFKQAVGPGGFNGVRFATTCWAWHARQRYGRMIGHSPTRGRDLAAALKRQLHTLDHVKVINSGLNSLERYGISTAPQFSVDELKATVALAHANGLPVMVHANGRAAVAEAIEAGCDSIEHGYFMGPENLARMADKAIAWVPTAVPMAALSQDDSLDAGQRDVARRTLDHQLEQIYHGLQSGVPIVLGTDAGSIGVDHGSSIAREIGLLMSAGLSPEQAVHCATGRAARLLRMPDAGGFLTADRRADLIAVAGRPEDLPKAVASPEAICLGGRWHKGPLPGGGH
jgi:imidazolonepropionase-like amidohydrolase